MKKISAADLHVAFAGSGRGTVVREIERVDEEIARASCIVADGLSPSDIRWGEQQERDLNQPGTALDWARTHKRMRQIGEQKKGSQTTPPAPKSKQYDVERQTVNIEVVGKMLGISRAVAYELARKDELPVPVIRIGRRMVVSKSAIEELLSRHHPADAE